MPFGAYYPGQHLGGDSPLSQRAAIANVRYCHVMYKLLYPIIRVRTAPPVSVRVRVRVGVSFILRIFAIADLNRWCTETAKCDSWSPDGVVMQCHHFWMGPKSRGFADVGDDSYKLEVWTHET